MAQPHIQASFNSGEWAPNLYARVDLQKYQSGAALLRNWFVDYRGGASTRPGTKYVLRAFDSVHEVRLIPFQASFNIGYILEFGQSYIRFHTNGGAVLETGIAITGATQANPAVITVANTWAVGDWVYTSGVSGMTELNGHYYIITARDAGHITISDLFGTAVDSTTFGAWTSGGTAARVYTISSSYLGSDLQLVKYALNVDTMVLCHPSYSTSSLQISASTTWVLAPIVFGTTVSTPTPGTVTTTSAAGTTCYAYKVTAVDADGQESAPTDPMVINNIGSISLSPGTITLTWTAVTNAVSYNVYKAIQTYVNPVPLGASYGFAGNVTGTSFADSNIAPDFSQGPPEVRNPFAPGSVITNAIITTAGSYTTRPTVSFAAPPAGTTATGVTLLKVVSAVKSAGGAGYAVNDTISLANSVILLVTGITAGVIDTVTIQNAGVINTALPANPVAQVSSSGAGTGATFTLGWGVLAIQFTNNGTGYLTPPAITFSAGAATATAVLGPEGAGNPSVPAFFQQRLVLAATLNNPQTLYMSQTAAYYNFNVSSPAQADDAITATLVSGSLNNIESMVPQPAGLIVLSDGGSWLINGGSSGSAVTPSSIIANAQSFVGANFIPPIIVNYDTLYVQAKGSSVRDSSYNFYANVFTGTDVSIIASHLFYSFQLKEWAWAEEPFKIAWAVRDDGKMLGFTFIKEQDFAAWTQHETLGLFKSVATIIEEVTHVDTTIGFVNAVYVVVERVVRAQTVKYIERFAERLFIDGVKDAWCVDSGLQYMGPPATTFTGGEHLAGLTCTGLADGDVIPPFVMPTSGAFTLTSAAEVVTVGLAFTPDLQTLELDLGEPTVQGKQKKINAVIVRCADTLGLSIGSDFDNLVVMKDLVRGNVGSMTNEPVVDLVTGDARTFIDPKWSPQGQYCIRQSLPLPATVLGVIPQISVGDTK